MRRATQSLTARAATIGIYATVPLLSLVVLEPSHFVMQTRQFTNLARRLA